MANKRHESRDDYLETILQLSLKGNPVRSIDLANAMGFSKPSISVAVKKYKEQGYLYIESTGELKLTDKGYQIASSILEKRNFLIKFFLEMGVNEEEATKTAHEIEHSISNELFEKMKEFLKK